MCPKGKCGSDVLTVQNKMKRICQVQCRSPEKKNKNKTKLSCCPAEFFVEFTERNQTRALGVVHEQKQILLSPADLREIVFAPIAGWLYSRLCFIESIDHSFSLVPSLSLLAPLSCLTLLSNKHTHTDRSTNLRNTLEAYTYTDNVVLKRKLMGCSCCRLWLRSCVGKRLRL